MYISYEFPSHTSLEVYGKTFRDPQEYISRSNVGVRGEVYILIKGNPHVHKAILNDSLSKEGKKVCILCSGYVLDDMKVNRDFVFGLLGEFDGEYVRPLIKDGNPVEIKL